MWITGDAVLDDLVVKILGVITPTAALAADDRQREIVKRSRFLARPEQRQGLSGKAPSDLVPPSTRIK